ncbi:MAG: SIMPL domain-containing protein [Cellvibrionales bacterium]|nr:SIMPL domain-containing protein [Cellvibrionales bacterium]
MRLHTFLILLIVNFFVFTKSFADMNETPPRIQLSSSASIKVMPDYLSFVVEVNKVKQSKAKAKEQVDQTVSKILASLKKYGIESENIDASQISASPKYNWTKNERVFVGEQVKRTVKVKLYDKEKYTDIVGDLAKLDITSYYQQGFGYNNIDAHLEQALIQAIEKAKRKAAVIAKQFDMEVSQLHEFSENPGPRPYPRMMAMAESAKNQDAAPLEIKPQEISATISATFNLK